MTDTIDALWAHVAKYRCTRARDVAEAGAQRAVLERLIDAYLDAGDESRAETMRLILSRPNACFFDLGFFVPPRWSLQCEVDVFGKGVTKYKDAPGTPRDLFERLVPHATALLRDAGE